MSNRRRLQPFDPSQPPPNPSMIIKRKSGTRGTGEDWTDEALALLRKLAHAGPQCETFMVIGFQPAASPVPGYLGVDVAVGGNGDMEEAVFLLREWLQAEADHRASQS